ncbi:MAG: transglycosylase domain-containing protein, partial [Bacteroides sp.]
MIKKIVYALWIFIATIALIAFVIFTFIAKGWIGYMPPVEELENPNYKFATEIISSDGKMLGTWSLSKENRVFVGYDELSTNVVQALIATEDVRFEDHSGIDIRALMRAVVKRGLFFQKNAGGGSTITQQLSKQLYSPGAGNFMERLLQKPIEWVIAVKLERYYTKEEILTMYLNKFDFLNNAVGIKTAANTYFSREPKDLKIEEAATLVGMCKNPSLYNPVRFNERTMGRRNTVIDQMRKADYITEEECDSLQALPLTLRYKRVDHKEGLATYFREYLRGMMTAKEPHQSDYRSWQQQKYYEDSLAWINNPLYGWCAKNKKKDGS